jgi:nucleoside-diphosphate-sugar epimerase
MIENGDKYRGQVFNLGLSDANLSKLDLANKVKEYIPKFNIIESNIGEDPDKRNYIISNKKIESTGFNLTYDLDYGILELMNAYEMIIPLSMSFRNY